MNFLIPKKGIKIKLNSEELEAILSKHFKRQIYIDSIGDWNEKSLKDNRGSNRVTMDFTLSVELVKSSNWRDLDALQN